MTRIHRHGPAAPPSAPEPRPAPPSAPAPDSTLAPAAASRRPASTAASGPGGDVFAGLVGAASARARPSGAAARPIPHNTIPPNHPEYWPQSVRSARLPLEVHHRPGEEADARKILGLLEDAWRRQVKLGFRPPPLAAGRDAMDVYLWRGPDQCYVSWRADHEATPHADASVFMVVDPHGKYGGERLGHTVAHELNHAFQAADDWYEFASAFEGTATFVEWEAAGLNDQLGEVFADYQKRPQWAFDRDDGGKTWHTYGFALYLRFLKERYAGGDASFVGKAWRLARNPPGAEDRQALNEPDLADALEKTLPGLRYVDSAAEFARWRFYTGRNAALRPGPGPRDPEIAKLPEVAVQVADLGRRATTRVAVDPPAQALGTSYVELRRAAAGAARDDDDLVTVSLRPPAQPGIRYVVQAVPGLDGATDGEVLDLADGRARVRLGADGKRTLILTAIPTDGRGDPDARSRKTYPVSLVIERD